MIKFEIKLVAAVALMLDVGEDEEGWERLDLWNPPDKSMVDISILISLGIAGMIGTNDFTLEICTKQFVEKKGTDWKPEYVLIVDKFDWLEIKPLINARIESCRRDSWDASVDELRKRFFWEYEPGWPTRKKPKPLPKSIFPKLPK